MQSTNFLLATNVVYAYLRFRQHVELQLKVKVDFKPAWLCYLWLQRGSYALVIDLIPSYALRLRHIYFVFKRKHATSSPLKPLVTPSFIVTGDQVFSCVKAIPSFL